MDWKTVIKTVAPTLATALGGPLSGAAVSVLANTLLGKDGTENDIAETVLHGLTPDEQIALKKADQDFAIQIQTLANDMHQADLDDVEDARKMAISITAAERTRIFWLGIFVLTVCTAIVLTLMFSTQAQQLDPQTRGTIIGLVSVFGTAVLYYYFGSSSASDKKTDTIAEAIKKISS